MFFFKFIFIIYIGILFETVIFAAYNPLLTYMFRFKKLSFEPNMTGNYTIDKYGDKETLNGFISFESKETIDKIVVVFQRCNPEGIDCEYFQSWTFRDVCSKLREKNQVWSSWYAAFDPQPICPFKKVNSYIRNGTFGFGQALLLYPDCVNYYWKVKQKLYAGEHCKGSYTVELSVFSYRKRNKKPSKQ